MTRVLLSSIVSLLVPLVPQVAAAQSDLGLWLEAGASFELGDRIEIAGGQHLRFDQDVSRVSAIIPELGVAIEVLGPIELGVGYRYENERDNDGKMSAQHRFHADAEVEIEVFRLRPSYRFRVQDNLEDELTTPTMRHRAKLEWRRRGLWRPEVSFELFERYDDGETEMRKRRYTVAVEFPRDDHTIEVFYRVDQPVNQMDPLLHIMGLGFGHDL